MARMRDLHIEIANAIEDGDDPYAAARIYLALNGVEDADEGWTKGEIRAVERRLRWRRRTNLLRNLATLWKWPA